VEERLVSERYAKDNGFETCRGTRKQSLDNMEEKKREEWR